jgi:archaemetzincin
MKQLFFILLIISTILFVSCKSPVSEKASVVKENHVVSATAKVNQPVAIDIVPFTDVPLGLTNYIFKEFIKIYPNSKLLNPIPLPGSAWYPARNRYRADTLLRQLSAKTPLGHVTLALTTKDISCTNGKFADWGIMGLSYCPGKACVASIHRLKNNKEQFFRIAIHELGHTQGLPHCPNASCLMQDAKGKSIPVFVKDFCKECKNVLVKAGWLL